MNAYQQVWWNRARCDHELLLTLRSQKSPPCHQLHYLQMVTEKLGKAYFWRTGKPPGKSHASFVRALQALDNRPTADVTRIAKLVGFTRPEDYKNWITTITPPAHALERLAPALAGDNGPNPEYPWPRNAPIHAPATHEFEVWKLLTATGRGHQLIKVIDTAVLGFAEYA